MLDTLLSNPLFVVIALMALAGILFFWNKRNATKNRDRRQRNFRKNYYDRRKKDRE